MILPRAIRLNPRTHLPWIDFRDKERDKVWTPAQTWVWEKASYTVPNTVSEERVRDTAWRYKRKWGKSLEFQGWMVLEIGEPELDRSVVAFGLCDPDRRRYVIYAKVTRRPQTITLDVPDADIAIYQKAGWKLA